MQHKKAVALSSAMRDQCLGSRVARLQRVISRQFDQKVRTLGLTMPQMEILAVLVMRGAVRPSVIADALSIERSTISRNVALMERNGWVTVATESGRTRTVSITRSGTHLLASASDAWNEAQQDVLERLGADAIGTLDGWLNQLTDTPV